MAQAIVEDAFTGQESEQIHINEEKDSVEINAELAVNATNTISTNITKINCSLEKTYGPVEVGHIYKIILCRINKKYSF